MDSVKSKTGALAQSMASHFNSIHNTIIGVIALLIISALPLAALIIGSLRINDCPIQHMIPIWLLVVGAVGVASFGCLILALICRVWCCYDSKSNDGVFIGCTGCLACVIFIFYFAWMIAGAVWIFRVKATVQFNDPTSTNYCNQSAYNFAFGLVITQLALVGLFNCCLGCGLLISKCC